MNSVYDSHSKRLPILRCDFFFIISYTHNVEERTYMFQANQLRKFLYLAFFILFCVLCSASLKAEAMKVTHYPYKNIYNALPSKFQNSDYIYTLDDIPYIAFATYDGNNDYKTSIKKTVGKNDVLYCVDYSKYVTFEKNFSAKNNLFNNKLRTRLGTAFYYGTTKWGQKANAKFTTGNAILDYYMTQVVVHSLIYKYGGGKSNYGIDYNLLSFKSNTGTLKKKTAEFYKFCCNMKITLEKGEFQTASFSFEQPDSSQLMMDSDSLISSRVLCNTDIDSSSINSFNRQITSSEVPANSISFENEHAEFNSAFKVKIPLSIVNQMQPGNHLIKVSQQIKFKRKIAGFWKCSDSGFEDTNQEVGSLITHDDSISNSIDFEFLIGEVILYKRDSITGETITDALFQLLQYDDNIGDFRYDKDLTYNPIKKCYESGNLYIRKENKNGRFKIIEKKSGANYLNDWDGEEFTLTKNRYSYEYIVENQPVLGKLKLYKKGEKLVFSENRFKKSGTVSLKGIKFSLFAENDIYVKGKVFYKAKQKIADVITNENGEVVVDNLPAGDYYLKENSTNDLYILDPESSHFSITRDSHRKYSEVSYQLTNQLKNCQIQLFKYYYSQRDKEKRNKLPLQGAKFGLYAQNDIINAAGECILKKDSLIAEKYSDQDGMITFHDLPYADYYIKELEAPKDFLLDDKKVTIRKEELQPIMPDDKKQSTDNKDSKNEKNEHTDEEREVIYNAYKEVLNQKQLYKIKLTKYGENFSDVKEMVSENGPYYAYVCGKKTLDQVSFSLYDGENHLIATKTTPSDGTVYFSDLEPGKYYYIEDSCPGKYLKIPDKTEITCDADHTPSNSSKSDHPKSTNDTLLQPVIEETVMNKLCSVNLSICKLGEQFKINTKGISYETMPMKDIIFGIYQEFDYPISSDKILPKGSCVGYLVTEEDGNAHFKGKLPAGNYYLKELRTNPGYEIDSNIYHFLVDLKQNQDQTIQLENQNIFTNKLSKSSVQIKKTDANTGKVLKNVEFTLYNDKDQAIGIYKTDKNGRILVEDLPYGHYYFIETKCKNGYYSTNNKYKFTLQSKERILLNITNAPILKLGFEEHFKKGLLSIFVMFLSVILCIMLGYFKQRNKK